VAVAAAHRRSRFAHRFRWSLRCNTRKAHTQCQSRHTQKQTLHSRMHFDVNRSHPFHMRSFKLPCHISTALPSQLECTHEWLIDTDSINALHAVPRTHALADDTDPLSPPRPLMYWTTDAGWCARFSDGSHTVFPRPSQRPSQRQRYGDHRDDAGGDNDNDGDTNTRGRHQSPPHLHHRSASADQQQHQSAAEGTSFVVSINCERQSRICGERKGRLLIRFHSCFLFLFLFFLMAVL
jgi:hypothetical protein